MSLVNSINLTENTIINLKIISEENGDKIKIKTNQLQQKNLGLFF
jgi:hypothetical protein